MGLFNFKLWYDAPNPLTPVSAAALNDLEARIAAMDDARPTGRLTNTAGLATVTATWKILTWDTEAYDSANEHSTASNTSRIVASKAGVYAAYAHARFPISAGGTVRYLEILKNSGGTGGLGTYVALDSGFPNAAAQVDLNAYGQIKMAVGDYIEAHAYQDSGGNLNTDATFGLLGWHYVGTG